MKLKVNQTKLLSNLSKTFTDEYAVVRELLQNCKRANATAVSVSYDTETAILTVSNNGDPIEDFQDLIHVSHSGWKPLPLNEKPYGIGFLSVIFSSTEDVIIQSHGRQLTINPKSLLNGEDIGEPVLVETSTYTSITLTVPGLDISEIQQQVYYFNPDILVSLNSYPCTRIKRHYEAPIPEGRLIVTSPLCDIRNPETNVPRTYQGFKVAAQGGNYVEAYGFHVELDQLKFDARLPDRNFILDYSDEVHETLKRNVRFALIELLKELPEAELLECTNVLKNLKALYLLEDFNTLPPRETFTPPKDLTELRCGTSYYNIHDNTEAVVTKSDVVIKVDSLQLDENNYQEFYTASKLGGSVCTTYGNTDFLPECEEAPDWEIILDWLPVADKEAYIYEDPTDERLFCIVDDKLHINYKEDTPPSLQGILNLFTDYERYSDGTRDIWEDISYVENSLETYGMTREGAKINYTSLLKQRIDSMPELSHGKTFTLTVKEDGNYSVELAD